MGDEEMRMTRLLFVSILGLLLMGFCGAPLQAQMLFMSMPEPCAAVRLNQTKRRRQGTGSENGRCKAGHTTNSAAQNGRKKPVLMSRT
jgi:hypothetical protein